MDLDTQYWLNRVAVKLYGAFVAGADFELDEHRWVFDWNENLKTEENLLDVVAEDNALIVFTTVGAIRSGSKVNYFRDQQLEALANPEKEGIGMWGDRWEATDPAHREYDYITFIDDFHYGEFMRFCEEQNINYKDDGIFATLEIHKQKPVVRIRDTTYIMKTLRSGSTLDIIEKILSNQHLDKHTTFDDLRRWRKNAGAYMEQKYFTQIFRNDNIFHKSNALSPFAIILSDSITLKSQTLLTPQQLAIIKKSSIN